MIGLTLSTPLVAAVLAALVAGLLNVLLRWDKVWARFVPWLGGVGLLGGLLLTLLCDQHGPPLLVGALGSLLLLYFGDGPRGGNG